LNRIDCGGSFFTAVMIDYVLERLEPDSLNEIKNNRRQMMRAWDACERAKIDMSQHPEANIEITGFPVKDRSVSYRIGTEDLQVRSEIFLKDIKKFIDDTQTAVTISNNDYEVLIIGGNSANPCVRDLLSTYNWTEAILLGDKEDAVAAGCAVAKMLSDTVGISMIKQYHSLN